MEYMHLGDTNGPTVRQWLESKGLGVTFNDGGTVTIIEPGENGASTTVAVGKVVCVHDGRVEVRDTPPEAPKREVRDRS
jgi:hypothetical protein